MIGQCHLVGSGGGGNKVLKKMMYRRPEVVFKLFQHNIKMVMNSYEDLVNWRVKQSRNKAEKYRIIKH